jgi:hypothetical protein
LPAAQSAVERHSTHADALEPAAQRGVVPPHGLQAAPQASSVAHATQAAAAHRWNAPHGVSLAAYEQAPPSHAPGLANVSSVEGSLHAGGGGASHTTRAHGSLAHRSRVQPNAHVCTLDA